MATNLKGPGIYLAQQGFGIRIEDQVVITDGPADVITSAIPKDPAVIEQLMKAAKK